MTKDEEFYQLIDLDEEFKEYRILSASVDFWAFCLYMDYDFFNSRKKVLEEIAEDMQRLIEPKPPQKEIDILNVSVPPRTGKSYLATLFCAWSFGKYPKESILRTTVTSRLYYKFSKDLRDIITGESHKNRYKDIFPEIKMKTEGLEGWEIKGSKQGISYFGSGFEGSIIGFGASLLSIVDDSIGDEFTALNENALDKKFTWYTSAQDSREEKGCKKLFIGTRWSKKDIVGRLQSLGLFDNDNAKYISTPAIIDGKSYCEEIHTIKSLLKKKKLTSDFIWLAEWMQEPVEAKGLLFPMEELNLFTMEDLNGREPDGIISVCDVADEGSDSLASPIAYIFGENLYIMDLVFSKEKVEITAPLVSGMYDRYKVKRSRFESNNGGKLYSYKVEDNLKGNTFIEWKPNMKNKHTRILMQSGNIKEKVYFRKDIEEGSEYYNFMMELTTYNKLGNSKHDDAPDSITMLLEYIEDEIQIKGFRGGI